MRAGISWLSTFCATSVSDVKYVQLGLYMRHRQCQWGASNRITEGKKSCEASVRRRTSSLRVAAGASFRLCARALPLKSEDIGFLIPKDNCTKRLVLFKPAHCRIKIQL